LRALVLSGGGAKGAFQLGVLEKLIERGYDAQILCGVSVGAINATFLAMARPGPGGFRVAFERLLGIWMGMYGDKSIFRRRTLGLVAALWKDGIHDTAPLAALIRKNLDEDAVKSSGRKLRIGACALEDGEYREVNEATPGLADWVLASAAFPVFFPPVRIDRKTWTDGGVKEVAPVSAAAKLGATQIDVILCSPRHDAAFNTSDDKAGFKFNALDVAMRAIDLMGHEVLRNDVAVCGLTNGVRLRVIEPPKSLTANPLCFDPAELRRMYEVGAEVGRGVAG